jgi:hypothetical protein
VRCAQSSTLIPRVDHGSEHHRRHTLSNLHRQGIASAALLGVATIAITLEGLSSKPCHVSQLEWVMVPSSVLTTEDLAAWLCMHGSGLNVDLCKRHFRPKGGYDKERYSLTWHEDPHPHWYLPFLTSGTKLRSGSVCSAERIALICEGKDIAIEGVTFEGVVISATGCLDDCFLSTSRVLVAPSRRWVILCVARRAR